MKVTDYVLIQYVALERNTQNDEMDLRVLRVCRRGLCLKILKTEPNESVQMKKKDVYLGITPFAF